jgi:two-component system phosphate regulon sensor histidine kinase PhoR
LERGESIPKTTIDRALVQVDALSTLIGQIADASRLATDREELAETRFDPTTIVRREIERQRQECPRYQWSYESETPATIAGDPTAIERIFRALLKNAAQFSPPETSIVVTSALHGSGIEFAISDQGIGIPKSEQTRIFDLFIRASNASTQSAQGLGLGLFITRALVEAHQGRITVDSDVGRGSTFRVWFPVVVPAH